MPRRDYVKHPYPAWALPRPRRRQPTRTPALAVFYAERARRGGLGRARALSARELRAIALLGVEARLAKSTPKERSDRARVAGIAGNKKRWGSARVDVLGFAA